MIHLGDITAINGYAVPPVDVVIGGSPCQDLSIAGKQVGLSGERSGLFLEQIRIVKELRDEDRKRGRTGEFVRPRFMVWENVPGAFSSNRGRDFQVVLQETIRIAQPDAPDIPRPKKWPLADAYFGDGWSVAYRVFDAQFWGVAQRRRRIALIADFGGHAAPEILFVRESVSGHFAKSGTPEKETAGSAGDGAHPAIAGSSPVDGEPNAIAQGFGETGIGYWQPGIQTLRAEGENRPSRPSNVVVQNGVKCLNPWDSQSGRVYDADGAFHSLVSCENAGMQRDAVFTAVPINTMVATRHKALGRGTGFGVGEPGDPAFTLSTAHSHAIGVIPIHDKATRYKGGGDTRNDDGSGNGFGVGHDGDPCPTLSTADRHAVYCLQGNGIDRSNAAGCAGKGWTENVSYTLNTTDRHAVFDARGNGSGQTANTITGDHESRVTDYTALVMSVHQNQNGEVRIGEVANTLSTNGNASGRNAPFVFGLGSEHNAYPEQSGTLRAHCSGGTEQKVVVAVDCRDGTESDVNGTLQAKESGGYSVNCQNVVRVIANIIYGIVRRLTPLECERLQGFPDGWTDIGTWTDSAGKVRKTSDAARYKALGNSIALPPWKWVLKRISAQYERDATLGSLFDGIGGFPLLWEQINGKGSCIWASEIEEFPIAVTRRHFG